MLFLEAFHCWSILLTIYHSFQRKPFWKCQTKTEKRKELNNDYTMWQLHTSIINLHYIQSIWFKDGVNEQKNVLAELLNLYWWTLALAGWINALISWYVLKSLSNNNQFKFNNPVICIFYNSELLRNSSDTFFSSSVFISVALRLHTFPWHHHKLTCSWLLTSDMSLVTDER